MTNEMRKEMEVLQVLIQAAMKILEHEGHISKEITKMSEAIEFRLQELENIAEGEVRQ